MKKRLMITGFIFLALILIAVGTGVVWYRWTVSRSQPQISGFVIVDGIADKVEIIRDVFGVPHITARNEPDLFFGMGYAMAQDRLWQMEVYRRLGLGRLSEVFGERFVEVDRYFRKLSANNKRLHIPKDLAFIPDSFLAGINAYQQRRQNRLPLEFKLLGYHPENWGVDDISAIFRILNWGLSIGWKVDPVAARVLKKVGEGKFREAFPEASGDAPLIIPEEIQDVSGEMRAISRVFQAVQQWASFSPSAASNNWVVSGQKSVTGKPILANDTHMGLSNPSLWWEVHLVCPSMNVAGFAIPGLPSIPVGHNRHMAWGVTNVMVDDVDFYREKLNPANPRQYWYRDHWQDMASSVQTIKIKGKGPLKVEILLTHHGPVISDGTPSGKTHSLAARWAVNEIDEPLRASYLLMKVGDINDMIHALQDWQAPGQNFVFADTNGHIGYWCCAVIPIRAKGSGLLPMPGWSGEYEWKGYVPFDQKPHVIDPEEGFIASANNKVSANTYPYTIGRYWEPIDRIQRIRRLINAKTKLSLADMQKMQMDVFCPLAAEITPQIIRVIRKRFPASQAQKLRNTLEGWDYQMSADSIAACIFEVPYRRMLENIFKDELGPILFARYLELTIFPPRALRQIMKTKSSAWIDNVETAETENLDDIVEKSLRQALDELGNSLGEDMDRWTWGRLHTLTFEHVMARKKPLDKIFNLGPFPVPGSHLTVNKQQYNYVEPYLVKDGVSQRMIVDLSAPDAALHVLPTGESGLLGNPHYDDQIDLYLNGKYHPAWMTRKEIERNAEGTLVLVPGETNASQ
jgi:penicillin amidase